MSNYTKLTDFATKDTLPSGNAAKIVKGTEIDDEFEAIETAIATKANTDSPALTGTPTAPTAASGTDTTQIATTAYVQSELSSATGSLVIDETYLDVSNTGTSGQLLSSDGDNTFTWIAAPTTQPPTMQVFTASGTWTKPANCTKIKVYVTGGGANSVNSTAGGSAGGTAIKIIDVSAISSETVTVGAAGATGGDSSFGAHCSATGGNSNGGAGGVGSNGDLNLQGGQGDSGGYNSSDSAGGHGGGSFWCGTTRSESNAPANAYGCGGGGTRSSAYGTRTGTDGIVVVEEFY